MLERAVMESLDSGKPIRECQHTDLPETINTLRWHAELIDKIYDSTASSSRCSSSSSARRSSAALRSAGVRERQRPSSNA
ncbi:aldehyde dehydrogenase family protein, partial [Pseudomonas aeruginosa]|uniref:aldehyde dehydrogenase family protein n=1 Tax=Pseudomonas aeruginosa TaxID=287 RepID=UPI001EE78153